MFIFFTAEDVVKSTTKYIPSVMLDRRKDVSSITYSINRSTLNLSFGALAFEFGHNKSSN